MFCSNLILLLSLPFYSYGCRPLKGYDVCYEVELVSVNSFSTVTLRKENFDMINVKLSSIYIPSHLKNMENNAKNHLRKLIEKYGSKYLRVVLKRSSMEGIIYGGGRNINKKMLSDGYCCATDDALRWFKKREKDAEIRKKGLWNWASCATESEFDSQQLSNGINVRINRVVDGDTVYVTKVNSADSAIIKVRMDHIDAPETKQQYGKQSTNHLKRLLHKNQDQVRLIGSEKDKYGRLLGVIKVGNVDINKMMVRDGYAWCYRYVECPKDYQSDMRTAQIERRGLFVKDNPETPWDWRKNKKSRF